MNKILLTGLILGGLNIMVSAQPGPIPPGTNTACNAGPGADTVVSVPDAEGFMSLFDGTSLKGWWESCKSSHSGADRILGGTWLADPTLHAIFSAQNPNGAGGLLVTNKKNFGNYEIIMDIWPDFNNDGGVFNRTTEDGKAYQATIDYILGSSIGGSFSEGISAAGGKTWNSDPFKFGANESSVSDGNTNWKTFTAAKNPTSFGCSAAGCVPADWTKIWDINGWNQFRVKFYGGLTAASKSRLETFIRDLKAPNKTWVPIMDESNAVVLPASYIALQIHGGTDRWKGAAGSWYRNIKWRPLDDKGDPLVTTSTKVQAALPLYRMTTTASSMEGYSDADFEITLRDLSGKIVERFSGLNGAFHHDFSTKTMGVLLMDFKTNRGVDHRRISRLF